MKLVKKHLKWFLARMTLDRLDATAAHASFFLMISFLPFLALLLTVMQRVHFADGLSMVERAMNYFPEGVVPFVKSLFPNPIDTTGVLPIAIVTALWTSATGMVAVIKGLEQIYRVKKRRNWLQMRLVALLYVAAMLAVILLTAALLVFGSTIYKFLLAHSSPFFAWLLANFKSVTGFALLWGFFTLEYSFLPRRRAKFIHNLAGAAVGAGGWVLFSYFFSLFVETFANFSIYGSLATLVILMYWLFFCIFIMFLGAEVSMWLETSSIQSDLNRARKGFRRKRARKKLEKSLQTEDEP